MVTLRFLNFVVSCLYYRAKKMQKPGPLVPLVPILFIGAYQADLAYGNKMTRCRGKHTDVEIKLFFLGNRYGDVYMSKFRLC